MGVVFYADQSSMRAELLAKIKATHEQLWSRFASREGTLPGADGVRTLLQGIDGRINRLEPWGDLGSDPSSGSSWIGQAPWNELATQVQGEQGRAATLIDQGAALPVVAGTAAVNSALEKARSWMTAANIPSTLQTVAIAVAIVFVFYFLIQLLGFVKTVRGAA
jgi:hypothetical protein